jgi:inositol-phosphate transport system substrate-binding protein
MRGYVAVLLVGILVFGAIASGCISSEKPTTPEKVEVSLTGDFVKDVVNIGKALESNGVNEVKFTVWGAGDPNSVMRVYGIVEAAERINKVFNENNINVKIVVDTNYVASFQQLFQDYLSKQPIGQAGDFFVNSYAFIPTLAKEGYILDVTEYAKAYEKELSDFYTPLMEASKWKGKLYGLPQDTEARPLYIRKDVAKCSGFDLTKLEEKVKNGEFTWSDVYAKAKAAKEKGCSEWGLIHRKGSAHPDLIQFIFAFGGTLYDENEDKLVLDVPAVYKWLYVEWKFARDGILPEDIMSWDWAKQIHPAIVSGNTLFDIGGTWYWAEWQTKDYYVDPKTNEPRGLKPEEVDAWFYYTLFPAGEKGQKPVTLSQPFVWMINSKAGAQNPKYDELKDIYQKLAFLMILKASDADINAIHSVISSHLPVRKAAEDLIKDEKWLNDLKNLNIDISSGVKAEIADIVKATVHPINAKFLADVSYMLEYTHLAPSHPKYPALADLFKDAVDKVLRGEMKPEEAVQFLIDRIKADPELSASVKIVGEVPKDWQFP